MNADMMQVSVHRLKHCLAETDDDIVLKKNKTVITG